MSVIKSIAGINIRSLISGFILLFIFICISCNGDHPSHKSNLIPYKIPDLTKKKVSYDDNQVLYTILVLPKNPVPGEVFRIFVTGGENLRKAQIIVNGPTGSLESLKSKNGDEIPKKMATEIKSKGSISL